MARLAFTIKQAAKACAVNDDDIVKAIRAESLIAHVRRNEVLILRADLELWFASSLRTWRPKQTDLQAVEP